MSQDPSSAADALWQFVTSVKSVRKRDDSTEPFQLAKLETAIRQSFQSAHKEEDAFTINNLLEHIYTQLQQTFDGVVTPTTAQIRTIVIETLRAHDGAVATAFEQGRGVKPSPMPTATPAPTTSMPEPTSIVSETPHAPRRRRLNEERKAITHKFQVGGHEGYLTVGLYDDGQPGEIFLKMSKEGTVMSGLMDSFATAVSIGLQYGVPLNVLVKKFADVKYEPNGATSNPNIPVARSIVDYIFRYLALKFLTPQEHQSINFRPSDHPFTDPSLPEIANVENQTAPLFDRHLHA